MTSQWVQILVATAAAIVAVGTIWAKVLRPGLDGYHAWRRMQDEMLPLLRSLTHEFRDTTHAFEILDEIVAQVRTDHGSSLLDIINDLTESARVSAQASTDLQRQADLAAGLAEFDRAQQNQVMGMLNTLIAKINVGLTGIADAASADKEVAADLAVAKGVVEGVAADLAETQTRADTPTRPDD